MNAAFHLAHGKGRKGKDRQRLEAFAADIQGLHGRFATLQRARVETVARSMEQVEVERAVSVRVRERSVEVE